MIIPLLSENLTMWGLGKYINFVKLIINNNYFYLIKISLFD